MNGIVIAIIGASASAFASIMAFVGVVVTNRKANEKLIQDMKEEIAVYRAVTDEKISELTREVRKHNNFAERMPVVENEIEHMHEDVKRLQKFHEK